MPTILIKHSRARYAGLRKPLVESGAHHNYTFGGFFAKKN
jgi:hypothetical protein